MQFILYIIGVAVVMIAQIKVQSAYRKYREISTMNGISGADAARRILDDNQLYDVEVVKQNNGNLSDFYDPKSNTVSLSPNVYDETSIASVAVAAHECGHAIQHAVGYKMIDIRNRILPMAVVSSQFSMIVIIVGLIFIRSSVGNLILTIGLLMFCVVALFQVVTLPVEFDASSRALKILSSNGMLVGDEVDDAKSMLNAAAFTYVAALFNTLIQILRIVILRNNSRRN